MKLSTTLTLTNLGLVAASVTATRAVLPPDSAMATTVLMPALLVAGAHHLIASSLVDREVDRLRRWLGALDLEKPDDAAAIRGRGGWLAPLAGSVRVLADAARQRIQQLEARRRELEIRLRLADAERQQAQVALESISDAVLVTDAFNELKIANPAAATALGISEQDRQKPIDTVVRDPALVKLIKETRQIGQPGQRRHVEHEVGHAGHRALYDVALACVPNERREVAGVIAVLRDVTRERRIAEVNSDFVAGVSHELRTPLSSIKAYIEMLADGEATDEQTRQQFYDIIQSEANRLSRLIDNILNITRFEAGTVRVQRERFGVAEAVDCALEVIRPQARARQILLEEFSGCDLSLVADRDMIHQALLNLLSNAVKYTPPGGKVWIEAAMDATGENVALSVCDTGLGIPPESLPHIFEKFYRVPDHKKIAKGSGLGLSLVRHIVETVHHGRIAVESQVGRGSRFTAVLPVVQV